MVKSAEHLGNLKSIIVVFMILITVSIIIYIIIRVIQYFIPGVGCSDKKSCELYKIYKSYIPLPVLTIYILAVIMGRNDKKIIITKYYLPSKKVPKGTVSP